MLETHLTTGWRFALNAKLVLLWVLVYVGFGVLALAPLLLVVPALIAHSTMQDWLTIGVCCLYWFLLLILFAFTNFYLTGLFVHAAGNFARTKSLNLRASAQAAWKRLASLLGAMLAVTAVSVVASAFMSLLLLGGRNVFLQLLRLLVSFLLGLAFLFVNYEVMVAGKRVMDSLRASVEIFRRKPLEVFIYMLVPSFLAGLLVLLALVPVALIALYCVPMVSKGFDVATAAFCAVLLMLALVLILIAAVFAHLFFLGTIASAFLELERSPTARTRARRR